MPIFIIYSYSFISKEDHDHDPALQIYSRRLLETLNFQKGEIGHKSGIGKVLNLSDF